VVVNVSTSEVEHFNKGVRCHPGEGKGFAKAAATVSRH
jgi:hypothetical protein